MEDKIINYIIFGGEMPEFEWPEVSMPDEF